MEEVKALKTEVSDLYAAGEEWRGKYFGLCAQVRRWDEILASIFFVESPTKTIKAMREEMKAAGGVE
jgi:hypothetical protein